MTVRTLYAACLARLGLSQAEAARLHGNSEETVRKRCSGKLAVPAGAWADLRALEAEIVDRSEAVRESVDDATERAGSPPLAIDAIVDERVELMGLADYVLSSELPIGEVQVGVVE